MGRESTYVSELKTELAQLPPVPHAAAAHFLPGCYITAVREPGEIGELTLKLEKEFENEFQTSEYTDIEAFSNVPDVFPRLSGDFFCRAV